MFLFNFITFPYVLLPQLTFSILFHRAFRVSLCFTLKMFSFHFSIIHYLTMFTFIVYIAFALCFSPLPITPFNAVLPPFSLFAPFLVFAVWLLYFWILPRFSLFYLPFLFQNSFCTMKAILFVSLLFICGAFAQTFVPLIPDVTNTTVLKGSFYPNGTLGIGKSMSFYTSVKDVKNGYGLSVYLSLCFVHSLSPPSQF